VEKGNLKKWMFSAEERNGRWQILDEKRKRKTRDGFGIPGLLAEPTGTDGFRFLCHQFSPSSKYPPLPSLRSSNKSSQGLISPPWLRPNVDQAQQIFPMASQKINGR